MKVEFHLSSVVSRCSNCWGSKVNGDTASLAGETRPRSMTFDPDLAIIFFESEKSFFQNDLERITARTNTLIKADRKVKRTTFEKRNKYKKNVRTIRKNLETDLFGT